jgi:spore germination cell wall hydrolase CwlJ-like protein
MAVGLSGVSRVAWIAIVAVGCQTAKPDGHGSMPSEQGHGDRVPISVEQQECMALAMYWEARGEGDLGMLAVGWTILNRSASPEFPLTPCEVVFDGGETPPCQFSWYCDGRSDRPRDWQSWQRAMRIAGELLTRPPNDPTRGALYFHSTLIDAVWHRGRTRTARIGSHDFYR